MQLGSAAQQQTPKQDHSAFTFWILLLKRLAKSSFISLCVTLQRWKKQKTKKNIQNDQEKSQQIHVWVAKRRDFLITFHDYKRVILKKGNRSNFSNQIAEKEIAEKKLIGGTQETVFNQDGKK